MCSEFELSGVDSNDLIYYGLNGGQSFKSTKAGFGTDRGHNLPQIAATNMAENVIICIWVNKWPSRKGLRCLAPQVRQVFSPLFLCCQRHYSYATFTLGSETRI